MAEFGLKVEYRPYECTACGHEVEIQTNHTDNCYSICKGCSWKGEGFGEGVRIPALGNGIYRAFKYSGDS
jgi:predicted nucleic acid-binding Zn ribbon protein